MHLLKMLISFILKQYVATFYLNILKLRGTDLQNFSTQKYKYHH